MGTMTSDRWQWLSYKEPLWTWPAKLAGDEYFTDEESLEQAIFDTKVREALEDLETAFSRRLLGLVNQLRLAVDRVQADLVAEARSDGISWTRIGIQLDVGRTAAHKRYGQGLTPERRDQLERETIAAIEWARDEAEREKDSGEPDDKALSTIEEFLTRIAERRVNKISGSRKDLK
ncbi:MAG: hypothetical protein ACRENX_03300 [Candidatus Dormibacteria bacterium]